MLSNSSCFKQKPCTFHMAGKIKVHGGFCFLKMG
jgi:hypothetical protein